MKLESMNVEKKPKIMIIPMIDIIFFLLVFFMMSMLTMVVQKSINLNLLDIDGTVGCYADRQCFL